MVARRAFVRSALTTTLANAVSSLAHIATWTSDTALLLLDFLVGIGGQPYAKSAAQRAAAALKAGRAGSLPVVFSMVKFRAGYRDIADPAHELGFRPHCDEGTRKQNTSAAIAERRVFGRSNNRARLYGYWTRGRCIPICPGCKGHRLRTLRVHCAPRSIPSYPGGSAVSIN